jgi:putative transposase
MDTDPPDQDDTPVEGDGPAYWTGGHTKHRLRFHLVWVPKYRKRVLTGALAQRLRDLLHEASEVNRWRIHELNIQPDHVHLLLQIEPERSVSRVMQHLKGGTSRAIRQEFPDLREFLWGKHLWADGYFAETVGQIEEAALRRYIREQQRPWPEEAAAPSQPRSRRRNS